MKKSDLFRKHHLFSLITRFDLQKGPLDLFVHLYFSHNRQLGSKDRAWIAQHVYRYFRWKNLIDRYCEMRGKKDEEDLFYEAVTADISTLIAAAHSQDPCVRVGFPKNLYEAIERSHGDAVDELCLFLNQEAPIILRTNTMKTTRENLCKELCSEGVASHPVPGSPTAIVLEKREKFSGLSSFKKGFFEVQDTGSQEICDLVQIEKGQTLLDFCAGSGGKSLGIAPKMQNQGQIFLHDIRKEALLEAKKRFCRAGVQNYQIIFHDDARRLSFIKGKIDYVLVDAPCSGTGTLRRNPDMKWKFREENLQNLVLEQRKIFDNALAYVKNGGHILYATCSLLREENQEQQAFFEKQYPYLKMEKQFFTDPLTSSSDGFYAVIFKKLDDKI